MNLIDALRGSEADHAVCTTYPFEPLFFSNYAIDPLQEAGVATPIILMDGQQYEKLAERQELTSRAIGQHYYLEPVTVESTFHPKVAFLAGESACHISVSSANITLSEYTTAAQLGQTITVSTETETESDRPTAHELAVAQDVRVFIDQLCQEYVSGRDVQTEMQRAVETTEWLEDRSRSESVSGGFVHNLQTSILEQVLNEIGDVNHVTLFAPFFGGKSALSEIDAQINAEEYEICIAEGNTHLDPEDAIQAFDEAVTFRPIQHDTRRWIHAKGIVFEGSWGTATLYGSPNITGQALLETASTGNLEAGLVHIDRDDSVISLWGQQSFPAQIGGEQAHSEFDFAEYSFGGNNEPSPSLTLADARVDRTEDDEILARFVAPDIADGETVTIESLTESTVEAAWTKDADDEDDGVLIRLPDAWAQSIVRLHTPDGMRSNYRQITTEPTAGTRKVGDVLRNDGRGAVQSLVDETLFLGVDIAPNVLTEAVSRLSEKYDKLEEHPPNVATNTTDDKNDNSTFSTGVSGISTTSRKPHLGLKDGMDYAEKRIESILQDYPTVASVEELLDHFENLWYYITRGLIRSSLTSQLEDPKSDDSGIETNLNVGRLHSICANRVTSIHDARYFERISNYVNQIQSIHPGSTADALDPTTVGDTFVIYPAMILSLMEWHGESFVGRFEFLRQYHTALTTANPLIGEWLIDGNAIIERLHHHETVLDEQVTDLGNRIEWDISLPVDFTPGLELLFYGFWFRELARKSDANLFENEAIFNQYHPEAIAEMARLALAGHDRVTTGDQYESLRKGRFDSIVRLTEGRSDPVPQLQSILERVQ